MKEIKNQKDFHQLMQAIDKYGKTTKTIPAYVSLEDQFMGKLLGMQKGSMSTYMIRLFISVIVVLLSIVLSYFIFQKYDILYLYIMLLGYSITGILFGIIDIKPNYKKEMFLHRKEIAQDLLINHKAIISNLQETHDLHKQFIESGQFTDTSVLYFTNKNINIEEQLDMYNTQKEFLEGCKKVYKKTESKSKPTWLKAVNCIN